MALIKYYWRLAYPKGIILSLLVVLTAALFLGARQQAELHRLEEEYYRQYLQNLEYHETVVEQQEALDYAGELLRLQQEKIDTIEGLQDGRIRISVEPVQIKKE